MNSEPENYRYGEENVLQDVAVWLSHPRSQETPATGLWIIYIHGGAWRDPEITSSSFQRTRDALASRCDPQMPPRIAGYASVNYRLTAHPNFPQDPTTTGPMNLRNATHPDHLIDVKTAIRYLQDKYGFGQRYILVGHSCGATLAFQTVMGKVTSSNPMSTDESFGPSIEPPFAIVGVEGIYDIRALRDTFKQYPIYHEFIGAAFGDQEDIWDGSSPARVFGQAGIEGGWKHGRLAILAHSMDDELVDIGQLHTMAKTLKAWETSGTQEGNHRVLFLDDLKGGHDEIWSQGSELARVIAKAIDELKVMEAFN